MTEQQPGQDPSLAIRTRELNLWYGTFQALFHPVAARAPSCAA